MMRYGAIRFALAAMLVVAGSTAGAQNVPSGFPVDRAFRGISISGFDVQKYKLTFTLARDAKAQRLQARGFSGCNTYTAEVVFREGRMDVFDPATTRRACGKAQRTTEQAFLTTLRMTRSWRLDGDRLILEGDSGRLLLRPAPAKGR